MLNRSQSYDAIIKALQAAKDLSETKAVRNHKIHLAGLDPQAVIEASHTFKTRLFGASEHKTFVHCIHEPEEDGNVAIIIASRPLHAITLNGLRYNESYS